MKLTNKILLIAFALVIIAIPLNKVLLKSKIERDPRFPFRSGNSSTIYNKYDSVYSIWMLKPHSNILIGGSYDIRIIKNDSSFVKINGSEKYFRENGSLCENNDFLSIVPFNQYSGPRINNISLNCKNIKYLRVWKGAIVTLEGFTQKEININAEDSAIVYVKDCSFDTAKIVGKNNCLFFINKAKYAGISMMNGSRAALNMDGGNAFGWVDKNSDFILQGKFNNYITRRNN